MQLRTTQPLHTPCLPPSLPPYSLPLSLTHLLTLSPLSIQVRARFVERFSMGAPFAGGEVRGPAIRDMSDRWVLSLGFKGLEGLGLCVGLRV